MEKCGKIWKNGHFSGRLWPDWGNTAWAAMTGLGSIGIKSLLLKIIDVLITINISVNKRWFSI